MNHEHDADWTHGPDPDSGLDSEDVLIEPATSDDVTTVAEDWIDLASEQLVYGSHVLPDANHDVILDVLSAYRFNDGLLVARVGDDIVGFATFSLERGSFDLDTTRGLLSNLFVKPHVRNRGVGTSLLEAAEHSLAESGASVVVLEAMAANESARRFYRRHGYETYRVGMERTLEQTAQEENDTHSKEDR